MPRITKKQLEEEIEELKHKARSSDEVVAALQEQIIESGGRNIELLGQVEERDDDNRLLMQKVGELTLELARKEADS